MQKPGVDTLMYYNTLMHITKYVSEILLKYHGSEVYKYFTTITERILRFSLINIPIINLKLHT